MRSVDAAALRALRSDSGSSQPLAPFRTIRPSAEANSTGMRLIAGLPTKPATKVLTGFENTVAGVSYCCSRPRCITAILSAMVTASSWSWVT